jgi:hypothetical protein
MVPLSEGFEMSTIFRAIGLAAIALCMPFTGTAIASTMSNYDCSVTGGSRFIVSASSFDASATLTDPFGTHRLTPQGGGVVRGTRPDGSSVSFDEGRQVLRVESEQFNCQPMLADNEMNDAQSHETGAVGGREIFNLNHQGYSLGGKLRGGPGTNFSQTGSLAEGTGITILTNTGVRFDGYDWFEVVTDRGTRGYHWGGIMCSNGARLDGIYTDCGTQVFTPPAQNASASSTARGWLAFAIGNGGRWGHGAGPTRNAARDYALSNCGSSNCRIEAETQSQCQALVLATNGGFWFGDASNEQQARDNALNFCWNAGGSCRVEYSYCQ